MESKWLRLKVEVKADSLGLASSTLYTPHPIRRFTLIACAYGI